MRRSVMSTNLERLNDAELEILGLLGQGHTIKSVAHLKEISEASVNERLRSARRKTGLGSSRQIARLIVAQENCHNFIGLAPETLRADPSPYEKAPCGGALDRQRRPLMIIAAALMASALLAQQTSVAPISKPIPTTAQPLFKGPSVPNLASLHAEVTDVSTDPEWSASTEIALIRTYQQIVGQSRLNQLDVTCSGALCEVIGITRANLATNERIDLLDDLQDQGVRRSIAELGLNNVVDSFNSGTGADVGSPLAFVSYWRRTN